MKISERILKYRRIFIQRGFLGFVRWFLEALWFKVFFAGRFYKLRSLTFFTLRGRKYRYFCHIYNNAWANERTVEIPIVLRFIKQHRTENILEVGNVLSHYVSVTHDVIDKYEKADGILNEDIAAFHPSKKYNLIVSISTMEHVGFDEHPQNPEKVANAFLNLRSMLAKGGIAVITFAMRYNVHMDKFWSENALSFNERYCLKRVSRYNFWKEIPLESIENPHYGLPYPGGNWVAIGIIRS